MGYVSSCVKVLGACRGHDSCLLWLILANGIYIYIQVFTSIPVNNYSLN